MSSLRNRLLLSVLPLCLFPLIGISIFSYFVAKGRITEDRIVLYLEQIATEIADAIHLTILEKREETVSMTLYSEFRGYLTGELREPPVRLLDKLLVVHEVYDVIALFDVEGRLVLTNSLNRSSRTNVIEYLDEKELAALRGQSLLRYTPESAWLRQVRSGSFGYINWHISPLVHQLYRYLDDDIAQQYSVGFAAPVLDDKSVVVGGVLALMNWQYVQEILDKVGEDLQERSLGSGYAFLFGNDHNTIIAHKYRRNRDYALGTANEISQTMDNYGTRLREDHRLEGLYEAIQATASYFSYEYPPGTPKISGLAPLNHDFFRWVCGVGINDEDIFAPVRELRTIQIWAAFVSVILLIVLTYSMARRITIPLKKLTEGAKVISGGDFSQRVTISARDEIGELATTFNQMAQSLEERSRALLDLNRRLEEKVEERTRELKQTNEQVQKAYQELKETQVQLIQSEKMASLGQLMAGIAHEIKNPLNFIYGNTDFLRKYVTRLRELVEFLETQVTHNSPNPAAVESFKETIHYSFLLEDLDTLIANFEEGAKRIHDIIGDLRTFSRMESDDFQTLDIHGPIDLALSLLQNEYRGRIEITRDYGELPEIECHPGKMNQVFMNLLLNACHAIPEQGHIRISTRAEEQGVSITVEDDGEGIRAESLGRIFEPFYTTKPVGTGTGLGLSISYAIIQQHKGSIDVQSEEGKGTRFFIRLPVKQ